MAAKLYKVVLALFLALAVSWQGASAASLNGSPAAQVARKCCAAGCRNCSNTACCKASTDSAYPIAPASVAFQVHLEPFISDVIVLPGFDAVAEAKPWPQNFLAASPCAIPLFQRNCSYLI
ncbi:MAG TPA: hypothetical protein VH413_17465 [Verrucomicrobiae bacterium]|jgi:hypothetical protein|nr:hypothetical protein [Verrucomicrobiae bacterium]